MLNRGVVIVRPKQPYLDSAGDWMTRGSCPIRTMSRLST
jgi:hypothetical protein